MRVDQMIKALFPLIVAIKFVRKAVTVTCLKSPDPQRVPVFRLFRRRTHNHRPGGFILCHERYYATEAVKRIMMVKVCLI